jgi:hypothetical protein
MSKESIGGIWAKEITVKGDKVIILNFTIEGKRYVAWPNKSENPKAPIYRIFPDEYVKKEQKKESSDGLPF